MDRDNKYENGKEKWSWMYVMTASVVGIFVLSSLLPAWAATQRSSPVFTDRKSGNFGMASELLEDFNENGDAWVTTGTSYIIIYQYNGNGYTTVNISRPQTSGTWGTFGFDVTCGDYNGDGYGDVIVSDPYWDDPQTNDDCGILVCYFSNNNPISGQTSEICIEGVNDDGLCGYSIDTGNFDGDDYDDLIVGEPGNTTYYGTSHIFLGCSSPGSWGSLDSSDWSVDGTSSDGNWGVCVRSVKDDDDDDDYDDFCISHNGTSGTSSFKSKIVSVYYGDSDIPGLSETPQLNLTPQNMPSQNKDGYGMDVDTGDFDGDGFTDIISMNKVYTQGKSEFWIIIFLGSSSKYSLQTYYNYRTHPEPRANVNSWKYDIATQGNDNGDAYDDVGYALYYYGPTTGMSSPSIDNNLGVEGFYGESSLGWSSSDWIIPFPYNGDLSMGLFHGKSLNGVGEQNGDSRDDLIVGTHLSNQIDLYEGE
jgi:hypothetical protein